MYKLPRIAKYDAKIRISQYKLLNNVLYLNRKIFHFGIITQPKCSICNLYDEHRNVLDQNYIIVNHLLLIFKYNVYNSRVNNTLSFQSLKCAISQIKYIEQTISENDLNKKRKISNKWKLIVDLF